eukprot:UN03471
MINLLIRTEKHQTPKCSKHFPKKPAAGQFFLFIFSTFLNICP